LIEHSAARFAGEPRGAGYPRHSRTRISPVRVPGKPELLRL